MIERDAVLGRERALDERRRAAPERAVLVEQIDLDVHRAQLRVERSAHRGLALAPALSRDDRRREERARDRAPARRAPEPRTLSVLQHHHHLDVADAAQRLGEALDARRSRAAEDRARDVREREVVRRVQHEPGARHVERGARREIDGLQLLERVVRPQPIAQRRALFGLFLRRAAAVGDEPFDAALREHARERRFVARVERRVEPRHLARAHHRRALGPQPREVVGADHRDAPAVLEEAHEVTRALDAGAPQEVRDHGDQRAHREHTEDAERPRSGAPCGVLLHALASTRSASAGPAPRAVRSLAS
ncbi:hypothetical protein DB32_003643 [Sandaracinus amylolyticus]|uniref:Uncharacterized protein n=1 Tax=Sandaracinus amylolyticus TaxID=927083 RepID=A0A0F6SF83_9BACT|nr:hypothetical protein DB32_003643 [Sandaracinus amylolyticus]